VLRSTSGQDFCRHLEADDDAGTWPESTATAALAEYSNRTVDASVAGEEVGLEFAEARLTTLQLGVRDTDETTTTSRAAPVGQIQHVGLTAQVTHVQLHAPAVNSE